MSCSACQAFEGFVLSGLVDDIEEELSGLIDGIQASGREQFYGWIRSVNALGVGQQELARRADNLGRADWAQEARQYAGELDGVQDALYWVVDTYLGGVDALPNVVPVRSGEADIFPGASPGTPRVAARAQGAGAPSAIGSRGPINVSPTNPRHASQASGSVSVPRGTVSVSPASPPRIFPTAAPRQATTVRTQVATAHRASPSLRPIQPGLQPRAQLGPSRPAVASQSEIRPAVRPVRAPGLSLHGLLDVPPGPLPARPVVGLAPAAAALVLKGLGIVTTAALVAYIAKCAAQYAVAKRQVEAAEANNNPDLLPDPEPTIIGTVTHGIGTLVLIAGAVLIFLNWDRVKTAARAVGQRKGS